MSQIREVLSPSGTALFCVPNIAHWYPRFRSTFGMFDYDQRGILDATHLRFFTRRSLASWSNAGGFAIRRIEPFGLPSRCARRRGHPGPHRPSRGSRAVDVWPTMFGYQFIVEATPVRT